MGKVLFCECAYADLISSDLRRKIFRSLESAGVEFAAVPDLCEMVADGDKIITDGVDKIIACYPRTVEWLMDAAGVSCSAEILNMREMGADEIVERVTSGGSGNNAVSDPAEPVKGDWVPWFPVIDYSRCKSCRQCMEFCLFGVYELSDDGRVVVAHPRNCKNNCPACARICPEVAIIFPKLKESPLNGDEIADENLEKARVQIDVDKILGSDVYSTLHERKRKRKKRLIKQCDIEQAEAERAACAACDVPCENAPKK